MCISFALSANSSTLNLRRNQVAAYVHDFFLTFGKVHNEYQAARKLSTIEEEEGGPNNSNNDNHDNTSRKGGSESRGQYNSSNNNNDDQDNTSRKGGSESRDQYNSSNNNNDDQDNTGRKGGSESRDQYDRSKKGGNGRLRNIESFNKKKDSASGNRKRSEKCLTPEALKEHTMKMESVQQDLFQVMSRSSQNV